jgi:putative PIN family toxin of toxin-antitoxin system
VVARAVLDTNVYVSAYGFGGLPAQLLRAAILGEFELVTSPVLLAEVARVLADKLEFDRERVEAAIMQIARIAAVVRPTERLAVVADEPDNRVLECAVCGGADTIVSGDRHVLELGEYAGIRVMSVAEALSELGQAG